MFRVLQAHLISSAPLEEHRLVLYMAGEQWTRVLEKGEALDSEEPWIFCNDNQSCELVKSGGGNVPVGGIVLLHPDGDISGTEGIDYTKECSRLGRVSISLLKPVQLTVNGDQYALRPQELFSREEGFALDRQKERFFGPIKTYSALPDLYQVSAEGIRKRIPRPFWQWRIPGGRWEDEASRLEPPIGPLDLRYTVEGESLFKTRILLLPASADLTLSPEEATSGTIILNQWGACNFIPQTKEVTVHSRMDNQSLKIDVSLQESMPLWVEGKLYWNKNPRPFSVKFPFPGAGAEAFDPAGRVLDSKIILDVRRFEGFRVKVMLSRKGDSAQLSFRHSSSGTERIRTYKNDTGRWIEIRPMDERGLIEELLAQDDHIESMVIVSAKEGDRWKPLFRVARYGLYARYLRDEWKVRIDKNKDVLPSQDLSETVLPLAIRLEDLSEDPLELSLDGSSSEIDLSVIRDVPGSWLVYPAKESRSFFRPVLCALPSISSGPTKSGLSYAIGTKDQNLREHLFQEVFETLCEDFNHPDWEWIETAYQRLGHLPLSALDVWRSATASSDMMAALVMRWSTISWDNFLDRFSRELFYFWELVPFSSWTKATKNLKRQLEARISSTVLKSVLDHQLESRIVALTRHSSSLFSILEMAKIQGCETQKSPYSKIQMQCLFSQLFEGEGSCYQRLLRNHDETWPVELSKFVEKVKRKAPVRTLFRDNESFRSAVVNLPVALASLAVMEGAASLRGEALSNRLSLKATMDFDREWFDDVFHRAVGILLNDES